ncbi:MAG TPA: hypothetical protein VHI98_13420, partial [Vicinamibacterales bacterium]|nr:hypothetical protein [Vicinamibacterales bacterium]
TTVVLFLSLLLSPLPARADNTSCKGAIFLVPDGSLHTGMFTAAGQLRWFRFAPKAGRSYSIGIENLSPTDLQPWVEFSEDNTRLESCTGPEFTTLFTESQEPASKAVKGTIGSARASFTAEKSVDVFFAISTGKVKQSYRIHVQETTMYSPWFTTMGTNETFYRLSNTTSGSVTATLRLVNEAGATVATHTVAIAADSVASVIYTGVAAPGMIGLTVADNTTGQAILTHSGPPGAIAISGSWGDGKTLFVPIAFTSRRQR